MFIANRMTQHPVTVTPETTLGDAINLVKKYKFARLPVVEDGKLVGLVSEKELMRHAPSPATTLSRYEVRELLDKLVVKDIMQKEFVTISDDATIEEAALLMATNNIGGLPVLSAVGNLVGVITEADIFRTFVDVMGLAEGKTRLTIATPDKVGVVYELSGIFTQNGLSIDSMVTCKQPNGQYEIVMRGDIPDVESIKSQIEAKGYKVIHTVKIG